MTLVERNSPARSVVKGVSWRVMASVTTVVLSYWLTGTLEAALKIGPLDFVSKLAVFYAHERLWLSDVAQRLENRRALKMALWKVIALTMTTATTFYVTGQLDLAITLGPADFFAKLFLFYAHELLWDHIGFGRDLVAVVEDATDVKKTS